MIYLLSILLGLLLGSFANVCIYRLPRNESVIYPRSHCPYCHHTIPAHHNIPILSYLWLRGHCFYCRHAISPQYAIVESSMALLFLFSAWRFQTSLYQNVVFDIVAFYLFTISVIDYHHKIIPDELSLSLIGIGWILSFQNPYLDARPYHPVIESVLATFAGGGFMLLMAWGGEKLFKKEALGGGDIKLIAGVGAILGWGGLAGSLVIGSLLGAVCGGLLLVLKRKKLGDTLPYGPFLCLGAFATSLWPQLWTPFLSP